MKTAATYKRNDKAKLVLGVLFIALFIISLI
jgi:hypothetical protein